MIYIVYVFTGWIDVVGVREICRYWIFGSLVFWEYIVVCFLGVSDLGWEVVLVVY